MVKFLVDEDIPRAIVRGAKRRNAQIDILRVQEVGLRTKEDPEILEWASREARIIISRDKSTMSYYAAERIRQNKTMPGLLLVHRHWHQHIRRIIDDLITIDECSVPEDWQQQICYLPF